MLTIREALPSDADPIWEMLKPVIRSGETYPFPMDTDKKSALDFWMNDDKKTYIAEENGEPLGTYYLKPNHIGAASHVCNCGYLTSEQARGRGVASQMCQHSLQKGRELGFRAMQYNLVVSTNEVAVALWQRQGFEIVGTLPKAFNHPKHGDVDAFVMYQFL